MSDDTHDIRTVDITSFDEETIEMEAKAKAACKILVKHYPAHLWAVGWAPGMTLVVRNMAIPGNYGYTIDAAKSFSSSDLDHLVMIAGGELLERCGFKRGEWNGEFASHVDGADPKHLHTL
jgi:hypothetical protein